MTKTEFCDFVVYLPEQTSIERYLPNHAYVREFLIPRALQFYFGKFVPLFLAKRNGFLQNGECELPSDVNVEYFKPDYMKFYANYGLE